jgi:hypothetical protein
LFRNNILNNFIKYLVLKIKNYYSRKIFISDICTGVVSIEIRIANGDRYRKLIFYLIIIKMTSRAEKRDLFPNKINISVSKIQNLVRI